MTTSETTSFLRVLCALAPCVCASLLAVGTAWGANRSLGVDGVTERFDLRYLPEHRYTGAQGERGDAEMLLDLYVPAGKGPFPLVVYVHGGGYGGGSKVVNNTNKRFVTRLLEEGFAVSSINYVLHPKGIFPQAWWDFTDAVRYLRKNAARYKLDPLRIGAYGLSAGGWLISSATVGNGDLLRKTNSTALTTEELKAAGWRIRMKEPGKHDNWLRPMRTPAPAWPGVHGGVSAISQDFDHYLRHLRPHNPYVQKWTGLDYVPKYWDGVVANGSAGIFEFARLIAERYKGQKVHVPPMYPKSEREADRATALLPDGTKAPLGEVMLDYFRRRLVEEPRLPSPEIYPIPRVVPPGETVEVSLVAPPGAKLFYSTDGSDPLASGKPYQKPFPVKGGTQVKASCSLPGFVSGGVNAAHFVEGPAPPGITGPQTLPPARTGEPYSVTFTSDREDARFLAWGELRPHVPFRGKNVLFPNNLALDSRTGVWSGTPWKPGRYWLQLWVNTGDGTLSTHRDYFLEVTGDELPGESWETQATATDQNAELARLTYAQGFHPGHLKDLTTHLMNRGVKFILVGEGDEDRLLLVERPARTQAKAALLEFAKLRKGLTEKIRFLNK